jgi:hypothetical protein
VADGRLKRLDDRVLGGPLQFIGAVFRFLVPAPIRHGVERLWDSPIGWVIPGGAPYKLGRRDGYDSTFFGSWLIWGVWGERLYDRGRRRTVSEHQQRDDI